MKQMVVTSLVEIFAFVALISKIQQVCDNNNEFREFPHSRTEYASARWMHRPGWHNE
jgi:hypothetical protein